MPRSDLNAHWHQTPQLRTGHGQHRGPICGGMIMLQILLKHAAYPCMPAISTSSMNKDEESLLLLHFLSG